MTTEQGTAVYVVRGLTENGKALYYTGRAGSPNMWLSDQKSEAFEYTLEGARYRALLFNRNTGLHGLRFVAEPRYQPIQD